MSLKIKNPHAVTLGRRGGKSKTAAKIEASRANAIVARSKRAAQMCKRIAKQMKGKSL